MNICSYGCGQEAKFQFKNGKFCCSNFFRCCEVKRNQYLETLKRTKDKRSELQKIVQNRPELKVRIKIAAEVARNRPEIKEKIKQANKISQNKPETRKKKSEVMKELCNRPESKKRFSEIGKRIQGEIHSRPEYRAKARKRMLDGHAVYMNQFIKNPSKPQVELFKMLQCLCPNPIMNYPIYYRKKWNYSIDIADPKLGLAFEYDEPYWHKHKGRDLLRQKRIEELGWKFLRYEKLPMLEQLKLDILQALKGGE